MKRRLAVALAAIALAAGLLIAVFAAGGQGAQGATTRHAHFPIILLVTRHHALQLMQHHWWCTRDEPGVFECTPAQLIR